MWNITNFLLLQQNLSKATTNYQQALSHYFDNVDKNKLYTDITNDLLQETTNFWLDYKNISFFYQYLITAKMKLNYSYSDYFINNFYGNKKELPAIRSDHQFSDNTWRDDVCFNLLKNTYHIYYDAINATIDNAKNSPNIDKVKFCLHQIMDVMSPLNFFHTNPIVIKETIESNAENLVKGSFNLLSDIKENFNRISTVNKDAFFVGKSLASSKGKVVFQNELLQLIQYNPSTEEVNDIPVLIVTAWINKYYILDLKESNSLVKYLIDSGNTVFAISWVNPSNSMSNISYDDYLKALADAVEHIRRSLKVPKVNALAYCLGGTLLVSYLAYCAKKQKDYINKAVLLTTLLDFSKCGELSVFINDKSISVLENYMKEKGVLDADILYTTFSFLKANNMLWSFYVHNYLLGKSPPSFDILYWNADSTRLSYKMHSFYLRNMYQNNLLIQPNKLELDGVKINLKDINTPVYFLAALEDHIAPWQSVYSGIHHLNSASKKFVLTASGHTAGVVNSASNNKYCYWVNDKLENNANDWLSNTKEFKGSWWPDMLNWLQDNNQNIKKVPKRLVENGLEDAPGSYVMMK